MVKFCFFGITINNSINPDLLLCFNNASSVVSWKKIISNGNIIYCLYYRNKYDTDIELSTQEQQQFQNELEMVESNELYQSYNDNFGYHCFTCQKKIVIS